MCLQFRTQYILKAFYQLLLLLTFKELQKTITGKMEGLETTESVVVMNVLNHWRKKVYQPLEYMSGFANLTIKLS